MPSPRYYSPRIDRGLVTRLYHAAKAQRIPMTTLTNQLLVHGLAQAEGIHSPPESLTVREDPEPGR